ncbi:hypothetical protein B0H19DRAFT_143221 [Mycena capillaripes]|nr:hypothetical protein B0H19DRAFT_143221 [Mycena capillaripes]
MPYAQMKNPYPVPIVAEQRPVSWFPPQCFPSSSTTHPSTTHPSTSRSDFGDHSAAVDFSNAHTNWPSASSATSPQGNSGFQLPSSSPGFNHGATPAFYPDSSRLYRMLVESTPPAKIPPTLPAIPHCEPGHELMPFTREHDTNPSPSTQAAFESGAPFGAHHAVGHGKYTAVKRRASIKAGKSGQCSQCPVTVSPLWRTHPHTGSPLCNACGQKARSKKRR